LHTVVAAFTADPDGPGAEALQAVSAFAMPIDELPPIWLRSAAKPFQLLPLLMHPAGASLLQDQRDVAIAVASHDGTAPHAARVRAIMQRASIRLEALRCGVHRPYFLQHLPASATEHAHLYDALHNNCSGNHAAMLLWAGACGVPSESYLDAQSVSQQLIHQVVRAATGGEPVLGIDNCGAPCYQVPLVGAARAYLALASGAQILNWDQTHRDSLSDLGPFEMLVDRLEQIAMAMATQPRWVSGEATEATRLAERFPGNLVLKHGAEGVLCVANRQRRAALALKVLDGNARALFPALLPLMQELGWWETGEDGLFTELARPQLKGPPGHLVGDLRLAATHSDQPPLADLHTPAV
jgi:L-asparaginase II